ncbi:MAG: ABC transporter permease [Bacteroidales bacterium]|nr:ABC transporter permease [Bacteroidales bacterium]
MFSNFLKTAIRNLVKQKGFSAINILGLAIGMAVFILIMLFVSDQFQYDQHNKKINRIYRLEHSKWAVMPTRIPDIILEQFPEAEDRVRIDNWGSNAMISYKDRDLYLENFIQADSSITNIFTFNFIKGNPKTALDEPFSIILTETTARELFDEQDPIGKVVSYNNKHDFKVNAIIEDVHHSHLEIDAIADFASKQTINNDPDFFTYISGRWNYPTYLLLSPNANPEKLEEKINDHFSRLAHWKDEGEMPEFNLRPLNDVYFENEITAFHNKRGNLQMVKIFIVIAVFIILVAVVNFINLSTARATKRSKEVGIRKVSGSTRNQLVTQFLSEAVIITIISAIIAIGLAEIALPQLNTMIEGNLSISYDWKLFVLFMSGTFILGLLAGLYPALQLTSFQPIEAVKGTQTKGTKGANFRRLLTIVQFVITIGLIASTLVLYQQMNYVQNKDLGFEKDHVVVIQLNRQLRDKLEPFRESLLQYPEIPIVSYTNQRHGKIAWTNSAELNGKKKRYKYIITDSYYIDLMGIEIIKGRNFHKNSQEDQANAVLMNETAARQFELDEPIGTKIPGHGTERRVIGLLKDYNYNSLHKNISPALVGWHPNYFTRAYVKVNGNNISQALQNIEKEWLAYSPEFPFRYNFLDRQFDELYRSEMQMTSLFTYFSLLAVFIACMGLLGLVTFTTTQKTKEIGIRKVFGASTQSLVVRLIRQFSLWVMLASVIAIPISWWLMSNWLENFAYHIDLQVINFLLAVLITLVIALATVFGQSLKAANTNPVNALRYE